jgi:tetratricopeptide (TPR) repeat protein
MNGEGREADDLARDYAKLGFQSAMQKLYDRKLTTAAIQRLDGAYVSPVYLALLYVHLGNRDKAFDYLDEAVRENAPWLQFLRVDPAFEPIRSDPRFEPLVRQYESAGWQVATH